MAMGPGVDGDRCRAPAQGSANHSAAWIAARACKPASSRGSLGTRTFTSRVRAPGSVPLRGPAPVVTDRLSRLEERLLLYRLEHRWRDGTILVGPPR
jgi:hypothetical protein